MWAGGASRGAARKALGASTSRILALLLWQLSRPVLLANLIAWLIAWWLMRRWLNGFAERIPLQPWLFPAAGLAALAPGLELTQFIGDEGA
ncbi:MAG TPA: FtsX-like permease family protein [Allosphingosinicella sp.]